MWFHILVTSYSVSEFKGLNTLAKFRNQNKEQEKINKYQVLFSKIRFYLAKTNFAPPGI